LESKVMAAADSKIFSPGGKLAVRVKAVDDDFLWEHVTPDGKPRSGTSARCLSSAPREALCVL
jgi:hypothetical protein